MAIARAADGRPAALWSLAFRPFFAATALWAAFALALWIVLFMTGGTLPSRFDPLTWHIHAMLFGFVPAAIAGFMLTAISNWTGRRPIHGAALAGLVSIWVLGRVDCLISTLVPLWAAAAVDLAFPFLLCAVAAREIIAARNWRNLMMPIPIAVLGIANLMTYLELAGVGVPAGLGWRLAIAAVISLITAVGGRIIPLFTRNWLIARGVATLPAAHGVLDRLALAALHTALLGWAFLPTLRPIGVLLLLAALLNVCRLARWRGWTTASEPLLAILHMGYAWVTFGAALLGASVLTNMVPEAAAIHAFTAGAIGTMILAVMTRVSRGHTGRPLRADRTTTAIYTAITLAGVSRVAAEFGKASSMALLDISALLWVTSFLLFALKYLPMLVEPRIDESRQSSYRSANVSS
ncbi:MAG: NnrS family protein [Rhizomicrobium sp.]